MRKYFIAICMSLSLGLFGQIETFPTILDAAGIMYLGEGSIVKTEGYFAAGDGGGALYKITKAANIPSAPDQGYVYPMTNGDYLVQVMDQPWVNTATFGIVCGNTSQAASNYTRLKRVAAVANALDYHIYLKSCKDTIYVEFPPNDTIDINNLSHKHLIIAGDGEAATVLKSHNSTGEGWFKFAAANRVSFVDITIVGYDMSPYGGMGGATQRLVSDTTEGWITITGTRDTVLLKRGGQAGITPAGSHGSVQLNRGDTLSHTDSLLWSPGQLAVQGDVFISGNVFAANLDTMAWNEAYGWGDHALAGYLTAESDGDPTNEFQLLSVDSSEHVPGVSRKFTFTLSDGNAVSVIDSMGTGGGSSGISLGDPITGGEPSRIFYEDAGNALAQDPGLTWDSTANTMYVGNSLYLGQDGSDPVLELGTTGTRISATSGLLRFYYNNFYAFNMTNIRFGSSNASGGAIRFSGASTTSPYVHRNNTPTFGIGGSMAGDVVMIANSKSAVVATDGGTSTNVEIGGSSGPFGSVTPGDGVVRINEVAVAPEGTMPSGGLLFVEADSLKYLSSSGDESILNIDLNTVDSTRLASDSILVYYQDGVEVGRDTISTPDVQPAGSNGAIQFAKGGVFSSSDSLYWDDTNRRLGIGTNAPTKELDVNGAAVLRAKSTNPNEVVLNILDSAGVSVAYINSIGQLVFDKRTVQGTGPKILGRSGSYIEMYNGTTGRIHLVPAFNGGVAIEGSLVIQGGLSGVTSFAMNGNLGIGNGNFIYGLQSNGTSGRIYPYRSGDGNLTLEASTVGALTSKIRLRTGTTTADRLVIDESGGVSIGTASIANTSAQLDIVSTTRGFLPPRMNTTQRDAIASPAAGLFLYHTSTGHFSGWDGSVWRDLAYVTEGDSTRLTQDSILLYYTGGSEVGRDTIRLAGPGIAPQTLTWNGTTGELSISGGNTVDLDGRYLESFTEADPIVGAVSGLVKADGAGNISAAVAGTDFAAASHTHVASDITDFDTEVSNNTDVAANTAARHDAVTVTDGSQVDFTLTGQNITASIIDNSITFAKMQDISTGHLIGRHSAGSGDPQQVGIDGGLEISGANLRRQALTGAITAAAGSNTTSLGTFTKVQLTTAVTDGTPIFDGDNVSSLTNDAGYITAEVDGSTTNELQDMTIDSSDHVAGSHRKFNISLSGGNTIAFIDSIGGGGSVVSPGPNYSISYDSLGTQSGSARFQYNYSTFEMKLLGRVAAYSYTGSIRHMSSAGNTFATDQYIISNGWNVTLEGDDMPQGRSLHIKNRSTISSLTVDAESGTIDGGANYLLPAGESATFVTDGTNWYVFD